MISQGEPTGSTDGLHRTGYRRPIWKRAYEKGYASWRPGLAHDVLLALKPFAALCNVARPRKVFLCTDTAATVSETKRYRSLRWRARVPAS